MNHFIKIVLVLFLVQLTVFTKAQNRADTSIIKSQFITLTKTPNFRNHTNVDQLNQTANYIKEYFLYFADSVFEQPYLVNGIEYKNVVAVFGINNKNRIIIGAHYDVCGNQEGADDNASGVIGLLELARMLKDKQLTNRVDLVAYTLEEPPFFRTEFMGSYVHAKSLVTEQANVYGMISLEMIGYFKDEKKSQEYPIGILSVIYGNKGNYITLVKKFGAGKFARKFSRKYKSKATVRTKKFTAPAKLTGIDFSDHLNYWKFGFSALMITDTSFYRNANYHQITDKMSTIDIKRMAKVIDSVYNALMAL